MKQTAVEWFNEEINKLNVGIDARMFIAKLFDKAKEMEKEAIMTAYYDGYAKDIPTPSGGYHRIDPEKYYNEAYKNKEQ